MEGLVVYQTAGLVDDDEREDGPRLDGDELGWRGPARRKQGLHTYML